MGVSLREVTVVHKWCFLPSELKIEVKVKPVSHRCGLASLTLTQCSGLGRKCSDLLDLVEAVLSDPGSSALPEGRSKEMEPSDPTDTHMHTHTQPLPLSALKQKRQGA